jgi:3-oxoacyl-(acyl-carrier-protein) synthase
LPPIYLHHPTVAAPQNLDHLWHSWLDSSRDSLAPCSPSCATLENALADTLQKIAPSPATPLVLATTKGDIDAEIAWIRQQDQTPTTEPPPTLATFAQDLAHRAGLTTEPRVVSTACSSGLVALIDAALSLLDDSSTPHLVAAFDHAGSFVHDGFTSLKALATTCRPFDKNRAGLTLGTAAAACLLSTNPSLVRLAGWGLACDATHMTAPDKNANGLLRAMQQALAHAQLAPQDIDLLFAHGTGTRYNDAMESLAFTTLFQNSPKKPAITAVKGLIGHTLGASGLLESLLATQILHYQIIPPITGLEHPEYPHLDLVTIPRPAPIKNILKVASGFGGLNAALILTKEHAA